MEEQGKHGQVDFSAYDFIAFSWKGILLVLKDA